MAGRENILCLNQMCDVVCWCNTNCAAYMLIRCQCKNLISKLNSQQILRLLYQQKNHFKIKLFLLSSISLYIHSNPLFLRLYMLKNNLLFLFYFTGKHLSGSAIWFLFSIFCKFMLSSKLMFYLCMRLFAFKTVINH